MDMDSPLMIDQEMLDEHLPIETIDTQPKTTGARTLYSTRNRQAAAKKPRRKVPRNNSRLSPTLTNGDQELLESLALDAGTNGEPAYFSCVQCQKIFWSESSLKHHSSLYHSEKAFVCEICGKAFRFRSNLAEHRSVHTSLKPYVCKFCGKSSRLKGNLTKHILKHHKKEQNAFIGKDDIIIKKGKKSVKDPVAVDFLEKSMIVLTNDSGVTTTVSQPLAAVPNGGSAAMQLYTMAQLASPNSSSQGDDSDGIPAALLLSGLGDGNTLTLDLKNRPTSEFDMEQSSVDPCTDELPVETESLPIESTSTPATSTSSPAPQSALNTIINHLSKSTQCHVCGKHFRKANQLEEHLKSKHERPPSDSSDSGQLDSAANHSGGSPFELGASANQRTTMRASANQRLLNGTPPVDPETNGEVARVLVGNDIREIKQLLRELKRESGAKRSSNKLETLLHSVDGRVGRLEKQVEMVLNSIYTLVQLQTSMNTAFTRFRDDALEQLKTLKTIVEQNTDANR